MKNVLKAFGFIALAVIIGFSMATCGDGVDDNNNEDSKPQTPETPQPFDDITATQLVSKIKIGWNLGNSLDTAPLTGTSQFWATTGEWPTLPTNPTVAQMETAWYCPITTKTTFTALKNAGFNAIRIPVSWLKAADSNQNIRSDWMARVVEIVNYAVENDMYIILNSHHDEMEHFDLSNAGVERSLTKFKKMWEQIALTFRNYNEKLIFEALNEPRNSAKGPNEWTGSQESYNNLNRHYQSFVDIVRASGGNNDKRLLMVNPFAAFCQAGEINGLVIPKDTVQNKIIVSIHMYYPHSFTTDEGTDTWNKNNVNDTKPITDGFDLAYNTFVSKGIPVITGEFGTVDKKNNISARTEWSGFAASYAKTKSIPCLYWDEGDAYSIFNRVTNRFIYPEILTAIMSGAGLSTTQPLPISDSSAAFLLTKNGEYGWQFDRIFLDPLLFSANSRKITQGDTYTFTYSFTSNVAIDYLQVVLLDFGESSNWEWKELSNNIKIKENIAANTVVSGSITIKATKTATNTNHRANRLVFQAGKGTVSAPILRFSKFEIKNDANGGGGTDVETVKGSFNAYAGNSFNSLSSSVNYQVIDLPSESRDNVLKVVNPGEWAVALYDLASSKGQNKTITFSAQVKRVGAAGTLNWQINNSDYPSVGTPINNAAAGTWHNMSGTWTGTPSDDNPKLFLSTYENSSTSTTYYIDNFTITVTP